MINNVLGYLTSFSLLYDALNKEEFPPYRFELKQDTLLHDIKPESFSIPPSQEQFHIDQVGDQITFKKGFIDQPVKIIVELIYE